MLFPIFKILFHGMLSFHLFEYLVYTISTILMSNNYKKSVYLNMVPADFSSSSTSNLTNHRLLHVHIITVPLP